MISMHIQKKACHIHKRDTTSDFNCIVTCLPSDIPGNGVYFMAYEMFLRRMTAEGQT
jgi:hypothetical protein